MKTHMPRLRFTLGSVLIFVAYAGLLSALYFHQSIIEQPFSLALLFFTLYTIDTLRSLPLISERTSRRAFLVKRTIHNLFWSVLVSTGFWAATRQRADWVIVCVAIVVSLDWVRWLAQRRSGPGRVRDRALAVLECFTSVPVPQEGTSKEGGS